MRGDEYARKKVLNAVKDAIQHGGATPHQVEHALESAAEWVHEEFAECVECGKVKPTDKFPDGSPDCYECIGGDEADE